ncbi:MAG: DUF4468 domain-containing protein [Bacteroidales bacterium]|nr:DUF4468 domain-containing protein [Bacteroidales bacterium]
MREGIIKKWQIDGENVSCQKIVDCPDLSKTEMYNRVMNWFNNNYSDVNSVILERDTVHGIITGKGVFKKVFVQNSVLRNSIVDTWHILKVEFRDGRAKITLSLTHYDESVRGSEPPDIHYQYPISKQFPFNPGGYQKDLYEKAFNTTNARAAETIASVEKALLSESPQTKKESW